MRSLILVTLCSLVAMVFTEQCFQASECSHLTCETGYDVACTSHQCTCEQSGGGGGHGHTACVTQADCGLHGHCSIGWHCIDGHCNCKHH
ncbi:uncharacterized protein LOC144625672 [Crassostrea virginica]